MSYAASPTVAPDLTSDATWRVWCKAISDALAAMGLVKTSDTGQVPAWTSRTFTDGAITSGTATLTSASGAAFTSADVGMQINIAGAGAAGATLQTTITAYTSATQVTVANNASTTVSGASCTIGQRKAGSTNTANGYEVWRFADTLQSTTPVYFKIEYGTGNTSSDVSLWLTVGTSTNGSGTITGQAGTRTQCGTNAVSNQTTVQTCVFCGDTNRVVIASTIGATSEWIGFSIERTKDGTGADTSTGILTFFFTISSGISWQYIPATGTVPAAVTTANVLTPAPNSVTSGVDGSTVNVFPIYHTRNGGFLNPGLNIVVYFNTDISSGSQVTIPMYGSNHNYFCVGTRSKTNLSQNGNTNVRPALRFE